MIFDDALAHVTGMIKGQELADKGIRFCGIQQEFCVSHTSNRPRRSSKACSLCLTMCERVGGCVADHVPGTAFSVVEVSHAEPHAQACGK